MPDSERAATRAAKGACELQARRGGLRSAETFAGSGQTQGGLEFNQKALPFRKSRMKAICCGAEYWSSVAWPGDVSETWSWERTGILRNICREIARARVVRLPRSAHAHAARRTFSAVTMLVELSGAGELT